MKVNVVVMEVKNYSKDIIITKIAALFILVTLLFSPVIWKLIFVWSAKNDYSHGFFVIPISLYMVWQKRGKLSSIRSKPSLIGLPIFVVSLVIYLISFIAKFHTLANFSIPFIILGLLLFLAGWELTKELIFPLFFLLFMFPIPSSYYIQLTNPLKLLMTKISAKIILLMGIPAYREGNILYLTSTQLEVTEACSGIRSLYAFMMLACLFVMLSTRLSIKITIIASVIPLAIAVNILRVTGTGILANLFGADVAQGFFHQFSGFVFFAIGLTFLLLEYLFLSSKTDPKRY